MSSVQELSRQQLERARVNRESYKVLLGMCQEQIRQRDSFGVKRHMFTVPFMLPDRPPYRPERALQYIVDKLRHGGYHAVPAGATCVLVDWSHVRPAMKDLRPAAKATMVSSPLRRLLRRP